MVGKNSTISVVFLGNKYGRINGGKTATRQETRGSASPEQEVAEPGRKTSLPNGLEVDAETVSRFPERGTVPSLVTLDRLATCAQSEHCRPKLTDASATPTDQAIRISAWLRIATGRRQRLCP